jgi:hypothetical protein
MKVPNRENAYIPLSKLHDYLLAEKHPVGRWKANFFRAHGFDVINATLLKQQLMTIIHFKDAKEIVSSTHGTKYIIDGAIETPVGGVVQVRTVWIIEAGQDRPRFVTAYPL